MSLLYVMRHAQASFGNEQYDQLSELGTIQSRVLGRFLKRCKIEFDFFFSGPKKRQMQTAFATMREIFTEGAPAQLRVIDELSEYEAARIIKCYFEMAGYSGDQAVEKIKETLKAPSYFFQLFKKAVRQWFAGDLVGNGLESRLEFRARVVRGLSLIGAHGDKSSKIAVFTSGGAIAAIMQEATGVPDETAFELAWDIRNASISVFEHRHNRFKLVSFNSIAHFELEGDSGLVTYR